MQQYDPEHSVWIFHGILLGQGNDNQQGSNIIQGNRINGADPSSGTGTSLQLTDSTKINDNQFSNLSVGLRIYSPLVTNTMLAGNQFNNVTLTTADDAGVTPQVIVPPYLVQWTVPASGTTAVPVGFGFVQTG